MSRGSVFGGEHENWFSNLEIFQGPEDSEDQRMKLRD